MKNYPLAAQKNIWGLVPSKVILRKSFNKNMLRDIRGGGGKKINK